MFFRPIKDAWDHLAGVVVIMRSSETTETGRASDMETTLRTAVLVPCYNEAVTIGAVVHSFRAALRDHVVVYVYNNNSSDETVAVARAAGAIVRSESHQGKGNVVRRMFADIDADVFVLVDGDGTYDAAAVPSLVTKLLEENLDFVNGARISVEAGALPSGHRFGNWFLTALVRAVFGRQFEDILSGYKVLSRRFVKSFPAMSSGFEIETELVVHALELRMPCAELLTEYKQRPGGSTSKLRTYRDGMRILLLIWQLVKNERPLAFFGMLGIVATLLGILLGIPLIITYAETGLVPRFPTAFLSASLVLIGALNFFTGLILDTVTKARQEMKRLIYLSIPVLNPSIDKRCELDRIW
jgi:glycosyltransferase involved in cell wall biosynthesis